MSIRCSWLRFQSRAPPPGPGLRGRASSRPSHERTPLTLGSFLSKKKKDLLLPFIGEVWRRRVAWLAVEAVAHAAPWQRPVVGQPCRASRAHAARPFFLLPVSDMAALEEQRQRVLIAEPQEEARRPRPARQGSHRRKRRGALPARRARPLQLRRPARPSWKASLLHRGRRLRRRTQEGTGALGVWEQDVRAERGGIASEDGSGNIASRWRWIPSLDSEGWFWRDCWNTFLP
jgi:hypothetical protein